MEGISISLDPLRKQFKVCLIGDGFVGKTSIRRTFLGQVFKRSYIATLGVDFAQKTLQMDKKPIYLIIWDIAGQPLFQGLRRRYYDGSSGLILVYSVVDRESFDNASKWLVEAHGFMGDLPPLIIVGNKIDLRPNHPKEETVSYEEGLEFTERFGEKMNTPSIFIEASALTGENIDEAFKKLAEMMIDKADGRLIGLKKIAPTKLREDKPTPIEDVQPTSPEQAQIQQTPNSDFIAPSIPDEARSSETVFPLEKSGPEVDRTVLSASDSAPQIEQVERPSAEIVNLHAELKRAESELTNVISGLDTALLNLRNTVHVKRMMYEHLKRQISKTRQEWADAYDEYVKTNQRKKDELEQKGKHIEAIRERIKRAEGSETE